MKKTVYVETTIISYMTARQSKDTITRGRQTLTRLWWREQRQKYNVVISEIVVREARAGDSDAANRRLKFLEKLASLPLSSEVATLAEAIVGEGVIPEKFIEDAFHVALCAIHDVDYLLTWNCRHLANATNFMYLWESVSRQGYKCPMICTPEGLMET